MSNIGFRILPFAQRPPQALIDELSTIATSLLSDNMQRVHSIAAELRPYHRPARMVGPALTVRVPPGDNLLVHKAIDIAGAGDVIVVDAGGVLAQAIIGEIMSHLAESRGVAGMVIDGAIRDADALAASTFPVYARGVTHRGPYKNGPGEINVPVAIGGAVVNPGDLVVGDGDGLLALPQADAPAVIRLAKAQGEKEAAILEAIRKGALDRTWVDEALRQRGCAF